MVKYQRTGPELCSSPLHRPSDARKMQCFDLPLKTGKWKTLKEVKDFKIDNI